MADKKLPSEVDSGVLVTYVDQGDGTFAPRVALGGTGGSPAVTVTSGNVGGFAKKPSITLTRGANTTPYTIGDEVGTASTAPTAITVARTAAGTGFIVGGRIVYSNAPAITPDLIVLVFSETVTLAGDNAQLALSDADAAKCLGVLYTQRAQPGSYSAGAAVTSGNLMIGLAPVAPIAFECPASVQTLFLAVVTLNAFTPIANSETLAVCLDVERD